MTLAHAVDKNIEPQITTQVLKAVLDLMSERGLDYHSTLNHQAIRWNLVQDPNAKIPLRQYITFYEKAAEYAQDPFLGLHLCLGVGPESLGALGYLVMNSPTLGEALTSLARYVHTLQDSTEMFAFEDAGLAGISYRIVESDIWPRRQDSEYSIGLTYQLISNFLSRKFELCEIHFEHEKPSRSMALENFFRCPVYYGQARNAILFDPAYLLHGSNARDTRLLPILENYMKNSLQDITSDNSFLKRVDTSLTDAMVEQGPTALKIAQSLGISKATLHRKARAVGTSIKQLIDRKRNLIAQNLLTHSDLSIRDIAYKVGFSDCAPFSRAFSRWNGVSPQKYRSLRRDPE